MRNLALMWVLAGCLLGCGGGAQTWYCGPEKKLRAVKATLKNGTLTVSGKGAMKDFLEPIGLIIEPWGRNQDKSFEEIYDESMKDGRAIHWPPWYFTFKYDTTILITDVVIEEGVTHIGDMAFACLPELKSVTISASVSSIGKEAFGLTGMGCCSHASSLTTITIAMDNTYYSSEDGILFNKNKTTLILYPRGRQQDTFTIPNSTITVGKDAFYYCKSLTSIIIPNNVTSIGKRAFAMCTNLTSITIPNSVKYIEKEAFEYCASLTSITVQNPSPPKLGEDAFRHIEENACLYVPEGSEAAYSLVEELKEFNCIKPIASAPK
jgi:hypothetical protein